MLLSFDTINFISHFIFIFLSMLIIEPPVGYLRAWIAKKMGDDTGEQMGYLTIDPFVHIDPLGLLAFYTLGIGWVNRVPINPNNITGRFKHIKLAVAMFSSCVAYILMAVVATIRYIIVARVGLNNVTALTPSSWANLFAMLFSAILSLCIVLGVLDLVVNCMLLIALAVSHNSSYHIVQLEFLALIAALFILLLWGHAIRRLMIYSVNAILVMLDNILSWFV